MAAKVSTIAKARAKKALANTGLSPEAKRLRNWMVKYLKARAVPLDWAIECGIELELQDEYRKGAIAFRYWNHDGTPREFKRWRLNSEQIAEREESDPDGGHKFEQLRESGVHVYMPPLRHKTLTMPGVLGDTKHRLIIAEGETRAPALNYHGEATIAIGGIDMYGKDGALCSDLLKIPWDGRETIYLFDADVATRPEKQRSVIRFTRLLEDQGALVKWLPVPDLGDGVTGADDFIEAKGIREFRTLLKTAKSPYDPTFAKWGDDGVNFVLDVTQTVPTEWSYEDAPALEYTWADFLPRGAVGLLIAEGGVGKTFFTQRLAQCIAAGIPFLGRMTRQGRAVLISCEEPTSELRRRHRRLFEHEVRDLSSLHTRREPAAIRKTFAESLSKNLHLISAVGQELYVITAKDFGVLQGKAMHILINALKQLGGVEFVSLDPVSRLHNLPSEDQQWGTSIVNAAERIAQEVGCTLWLPHHTGKNNDREDAYSARGASALPDAARVVNRLKIADVKECENIANVHVADAANGRVLKLVNAKMSYGPKQPPLWLQRDDDGVLHTFTPEFKATAKEYPEAVAKLHTWWTANGRTTLHLRAIRRSYREMFGSNVTKKQAEEIWRRAINDETLVSAGDGYVFKEE